MRYLDCHPYIQGGHSNHVHLVFELSRKFAISKIVQEIKKGSSRFIKDQWNFFPGFQGWQDGYGGFTYSRNERQQLIEYVRNQHVHHKSISFQEEYKTLLKEHGIEYDPRYLL